MNNIFKHVLFFLMIVSTSCLNAEENSKKDTRFYMELDLYTG